MPDFRNFIGQAKGPPAASLAAACGGGAAIGGLISMLGWMLNVPRFIDWDGDGITIKFNASVATFACGLAILMCAAAPRQRAAIRFIGGIVAVLGFLTLVEHIAGVDLRIDTLFFDEPPGSPATSAPGRMGIPSSLSFTLLGSSLLLIASKRWLGGASMLGAVVVLIAWMPISGYIFNAPQLYALVPFTSIALQTAFFLLFLGVGVVAAVPTRGLAEMFSRPDAGGALFRLLFLPLVVFSVGLTWLRLASVNAGLLGVASSGAIRSILELVGSVGLLWWVATSMSRADAARSAERRALSELDTHRMVDAAQEQERRRIARDLHDSVGQELTALRFLLHNLHEKHGDENIGHIERQAARLDAELSMLVWHLRPKVLDTYGLVDALDNFSRAWAASNHVDVRFVSSMPEERLRPDLETNLYRIAQEALNNIQKHARAKEVVISLNQLDGHVMLTVQDDGVGFTEQEEQEALHTTESGGFGLIGMRERAAVIGGRCEVESRPGEGTSVSVKVPLAQANAAGSS